MMNKDIISRLRIVVIIVSVLLVSKISYSQIYHFGLIDGDNCYEAVSLGDHEQIRGAMTVNGSCEEGNFNRFYFGFYAGENWLIGLNIDLYYSDGDIFLEESNLYGPSSYNFEACNTLYNSTPLFTESFQNIISYLDPVHSYDFSGYIESGYYLLEIVACVDSIDWESALKVDFKDDKMIFCHEPCDFTDCDIVPCDSLPPCEWYPLECDTCFVNPELCDSTTVPPSPCNNVITTIEEIDCPTCIGSFAPIPGELYQFEAWVREKDATPLDITYENPKIRIRYYDGFDTQIGQTVALGTSGPIIEEWQQISESLIVPQNAIRMEMELYVEEGNAYFDDVRVSPFNSAMKTYVYDQQNMRLVAEMDERNFATFYQYDDEGRMVAVKKETTRGIKTIQAVQQNTSTNNAP